MNNFIENASRFDIATGFHADPGPNAMLIQITDVNSDFVTPKYEFREVAQFRFDDVEDPNDPGAITDDDAAKITDLLLKAKRENMNVIVHCFAGLCRSGVVAEVGIILGFNPPDRIRIPNTLVKKKVMECLGYDINEKTSAFAQDFYNREFD